MGTPPSSPSPASVTAAPGSRRERRRRGRWRLPVISLLIAVASVIGVGLLLYPAAAAWFSQYAQSERIGDYADDIRDLGADTLRSELERVCCVDGFFSRIRGISAEVLIRCRTRRGRDGKLRTLIGSASLGRDAEGRVVDVQRWQTFSGSV